MEAHERSLKFEEIAVGRFGPKVEIWLLARVKTIGEKLDEVYGAQKKLRWKNEKHIFHPKFLIAPPP